MVSFWLLREMQDRNHPCPSFIWTSPPDKLAHSGGGGIAGGDNPMSGFCRDVYGLRRDGCGILLRTCRIHLCTCGILLCTCRIVLCTCGIHLCTCGLLLCTCGNYLCTCGIHLCTCGNYLCTCGILLCTCGNYLCTCGILLCTCRNCLCTCGILLCTCRNYLCTCGILLCTCGILLCKNAADGGAKGSVEYAPAHPVVLKSKKSGVPETHAGQGLPHAHGFQHQIAAQPSKGP